MIKKLLLVAAILGCIQTKTKAQAGAALSFDGTNDYITIPAVYSNEYTIEAWVKLNSLANRNIIAGTNSSGPSLFLSNCLRVNSAGLFEHYTYDGAAKTLQSSVTITAGTWYHVAISAKSNGVMKIVVNGNETISTFSVGTLWTGLTSFRLGQNTLGNFNYFNGSMDDFRVWNRQLCIDEILNNKDGEILTTAPGLATNMHFNQGLSGGGNSTVTSALDDSGFNRNGTLTNFTLSGTASNWVALVQLLQELLLLLLLCLQLVSPHQLHSFVVALKIHLQQVVRLIIVGQVHFPVKQTLQPIFTQSQLLMSLVIGMYKYLELM